MKSVLTSIQPKWCELIASGKKTVEVRKTRPNIDEPFKCYMYCTKAKKQDDMLWLSGKFGYITASEGSIYNKDYSRVGNGKVIGEFVCDEIFDIEPIQDGGYVIFGGDFKDTCLTESEFLKYGGGDALYGWHISDLVIYDKPRELDEFYHYCGDNPKCDNCEYYFYESGYEIEAYDECCSPCYCCKPLTRPPQSWCYVEGVA